LSLRSGTTLAGKQFKSATMKLHNAGTKALSTLGFILISLIAFAQDKATDINVTIDKNKGSNNWYTQPWVWIVGAAVFILLLVALLRNNSRD
jgi:hypothetical protein